MVRCWVSLTVGGGGVRANEEGTPRSEVEAPLCWAGGPPHKVMLKVALVQ